MTKLYQSDKAWVVSVNMGYGHQRASYPLKYLAPQGEVVTANNYRGIPERDRQIWEQSREFYEFISRFKKVPFVGRIAWGFYDRLQQIPNFYPRRDLSAMSLQVRKIYDLIEKEGWGRDLIDRLSKKPLPLITTFFVPAFMAEVFNYPGEIYCLTTDTDINRAWAPKYPASSRIKYFAPNYRVVERLKLYGVRSENIFLSGFPLPLENTGGLKLEILKKDLIQRLVNLDPDCRYFQHYNEVVEKYLGVKKLPKTSDHPLTLTFAVGGAGAQRDLGAVIINSLKNEILTGKIRIILVAGIHNTVSDYFKAEAKRINLASQLGKGLVIIYANNKEDYFKFFNQALRTTDILWTKPSELSFYAALGLPIIIAPPIGSQEDFNRKWLRTIGAGVSQENPQYTNQWLFDWIHSGWFAEAAMQGFVEAPKFGTYNIEQIMFHQAKKAKRPEMILQY
ncbi:MAG: hypothetical protein RB292_02140 [Patescibacteria group bacterium]|jgi:hypothetical protein|nr:hypothetical protein [Patescibacteria group bacterium]